MKKLAALAVLAAVVVAGCTQLGSIPASNTVTYRCPNGNLVGDLSMCPKANATQTNATQTSVVYVASENAISQSESEIFRLINQNRQGLSISSLTWNDAIANLSGAKSQEMAEIGYFDDTNPNGKAFQDVLNEDNVFYLSEGENIAMFGNVTSDEQLLSLSEKVVQKWLNSSDYRANMNSGAYSDIGVGVYCKGNVCYFTAGFVEAENTYSTTLDPSDWIVYSIYDEHLNLDYNVSTLIEVKSTKVVDTYIVSEKSSYYNFVSGYPIASISKFMHNDYVNITMVAHKGYSIVIYSNPDWVYGQTNVTVKIRYLNTV
jgi:uncharacterized protein YkwD